MISTYDAECNPRFMEVVKGVIEQILPHLSQGRRELNEADLYAAIPVLLDKLQKDLERAKVYAGGASMLVDGRLGYYRAPGLGIWVEGELATLTGSWPGDAYDRDRPHGEVAAYFPSRWL